HARHLSCECRACRGAHSEIGGAAANACGSLTESTMSLRKPAPFNRLLGLQVVRCSAERSEAQLPVREELCNGFGVLHGGAVMALGDTLGGMTTISGLPADGRTTTIESTTNFFAALR